MLVLTNRATKDVYDGELTLENEVARSLYLVVANASAVGRFRGVRRQHGGEQSYGPEVLLTPQTLPVDYCNGVQLRSAVAGQPAQVFAALMEQEDPQIVGGVPFNDVLTASGAVEAAAAGGLSVLAYNEFGADVAVGGSTEATATQIIAAPAVQLDGSTIILVEFFCPLVTAAAQQADIVCLYEDGTSIGRMGQHGPLQPGVGSGHSFVASRRLTPLAGSHTYAIRAFAAAGGAVYHAGGGGPGAFMPGFIRISRDG